MDNGGYYERNFHINTLPYYPIIRFKPGNIAFKAVELLTKAPTPLHRNQLIDGVWHNIPMAELLKRTGDKTTYIWADSDGHTFKFHSTWNSNFFMVAWRLGYIDYTKAGWIATPKGKAMIRRELQALAK